MNSDRNIPGRQPLRKFFFLKESFPHLESHTVQGCINQANYHLKDLHQHILDISNDDEDKYSNKYVYESNNGVNDNRNENSSDDEANN